MMWRGLATQMMTNLLLVMRRKTACILEKLYLVTITLFLIIDNIVYIDIRHTVVHYYSSLPVLNLQTLPLYL